MRFSGLNAVLACTDRYLMIDWKYKFKIVVDGLWTLTNAFAFGFLGSVFTDAKGIIPYSLQFFLLMGVFYWTCWSAPYVDTVTVISEEASIGTVGMLLTNQVSIPSILIGRNFASMVKSIIIAFVVIVPIMIFLGMINFSTLVSVLPLFLFSLTITGLFMLAISLFVASFNLILKKTGVLANVFLYGLRIASGMYFPVESLPAPFNVWVGMIPTASGLNLMRDLLILGYPGEYHGSIEAHWTSGQFLLLSIQSMLFGTIIMMLIALLVVSVFSKLAMKLGTIEHY